MLGAEVSGGLGPAETVECCSQRLSDFNWDKELYDLWNLPFALATHNFGGKSRRKKGNSFFGKKCQRVGHLQRVLKDGQEFTAQRREGGAVSVRYRCLECGRAGKWCSGCALEEVAGSNPGDFYRTRDTSLYIFFL